MANPRHLTVQKSLENSYCVLINWVDNYQKWQIIKELADVCHAKHCNLKGENTS